MKKTMIVILSALMVISAAGCKKINSDLMTVENPADSSTAEKVSPTDKNEENENDKAVTTAKRKYKKVYITEPSGSSDSESGNNANSEQDEENSQESNGGGDDYYESGANAYSADAIYKSAVEMYGSVIRGCPYKLNYDDTDSNGFVAISDPDVSDTNDIVSLYCTVFSEPNSYIYEKYVSEDGKVYCNDASRGINMYYSGTDLEYVSGDENYMTFNAVSHYRNSDTGEAMEDKTAIFSVILTDSGYKVDRFSYPE